MPHATIGLMRKAIPSQTAGGKGAIVSYKKAYRFEKAGILRKVPAFFFNYFQPVKIISLLLSFTILFTSVAPSYAQGSAAAEASRQQAVGNQLAATMERAAAREVLSQNNPYERAAYLVGKTYSAEIKLGVAQPIIDGCEKELRAAGVNEDTLAMTQEICKRGQCVGADLYAHACVKAAVDAAWDGKSEVLNEVHAVKGTQKYDGVALGISRLVALAGADLSDSEKIYAYEEGVLKSKGVCEDASWVKQISKSGQERVKQQAPAETARCEAALTALESVAVLGVLYPRKYQKRAEETIYRFMQSKKRDAMGAFGVYKGVLLLMGLNSENSYQLLEKFLEYERRIEVKDGNKRRA